GATGVGTVGRAQSLRVRAASLVGHEVGPNRVRGQQRHSVAQSLELATPMMSRPTRLHHDGGARPLGEERQEVLARKPLSLDDPPGAIGHRRLGQLYRDRWMVHRLLLSRFKWHLSPLT